MLRHHGLQPDIRLTGHPDDSTQFAAEACTRSHAPLIMVAGGDGTVNGVLNGLVPGVATLAVLPIGTTNVLARELGITSAADAVHRLIRGESREFSAGVATWAQGRRRFMLMAGAGIDGEIVAGMIPREKRVLGKGAYLLSAVRRLFQWDATQIRVNGGEEELCCHSVVIANAACYGGAFRLAPHAGLFSSTLEAVCIVGRRRRDFLRFALRAIAGRTQPRGEVTVITSRNIVISGDKAVQLDGDCCCRLPIAVTVQENMARIII
jgi:diacylglycerol kinase family enzyme